MHPDDLDILYRENCVLWEMQRYAEALQALEQAIALDPSQPRFYLAQATTLSYMGRAEEAQQAQIKYEHLMAESI